jgi:hypothetical protein
MRGLGLRITNVSSAPVVLTDMFGAPTLAAGAYRDFAYDNGTQASLESGTLNDLITAGTVTAAFQNGTTLDDDAIGRVMVGASAIADGGKGLVPTPAAADRLRFLRGDGVWAAGGGGGGGAGVVEIFLAGDCSTYLNAAVAAGARSITGTDYDAVGATKTVTLHVCGYVSSGTLTAHFRAYDVTAAAYLGSEVTTSSTTPVDLTDVVTLDDAAHIVEVHYWVTDGGGTTDVVVMASARFVVTYILP